MLKTAALLLLASTAHAGEAELLHCASFQMDKALYENAGADVRVLADTAVYECRDVQATEAERTAVYRALVAEYGSSTHAKKSCPSDPVQRLFVGAGC